MTGPTRFAFTQVDVFTDRPLLGNPLAVVHGADALDDARMQAFARWTNLSETSFLLAPTDPGADYRVRIFTPGGELPFAGHPTLGSCHAWLERGGVPKAPREVVQQCGVGLVRIRLEAGRDRVRRAAASSAPRSTRRLSMPCLPRSACRARAWSPRSGCATDRTGSASCSTPPRPCSRSSPEAGADEALGKVGVIGPHPRGQRMRIRGARLRRRSLGVAEDPVTGSLNASLAQWLIDAGRAPGRYVAAQGTKLGRAGRVHIAREDGAVWVGGSSVSCVRGELKL